MSENAASLFTSESILNSIGDGVYVTDLERKIVYWNSAAEQLTGWTKRDVLGKSCMDDILCHEDKEHRKMCGEDSCPLHRAIMTGESSASPIVLYAQNSKGSRIPVEVNVAPVHSNTGDIVGGVEIFRDMTGAFDDLTRARRIQAQSLKWNIPDDAPLRASVHYVPHDIIGGDYYALEQLSEKRFVFMSADVVGHGTSAALYTMHLRSLFDEHFDLFPDVAGFVTRLNHQLYELMHHNFSFAAVACGLIDMGTETVTLVGGAHPSPFIYRQSRPAEKMRISGFALGMVADADYEPQTHRFSPGDALFVYTDGAIENPDSQGHDLGEDGLMSMLQELGYPQKLSQHQQIEDAILLRTANVALGDDVTFLEFHWPSVDS